MKKQKQIKISVSDETFNLIKEKAKKLGLRHTTYCFNIIIEELRKELK